MKFTGGAAFPQQPTISQLTPQPGGAPQQGHLTAVSLNTHYGSGSQYYGQGSLTGTMSLPQPPAYTPHYVYPNGIEDGLTIRDHFAAQALVGFMLWEGAGAQVTFSPTDIAKRCFAVADAMLEERARE